MTVYTWPVQVNVGLAEGAAHRHRPRVVSSPVAVVTGGTRGIGAATAELLAARGHDLVLGYRSREEEARALAGRLSERGVEVRTVRCDVASDSDVEKLFAVADELGPLAALVNSAGVLEDQGRWSGSTPPAGHGCSPSTSSARPHAAVPRSTGCLPRTVAPAARSSTCPHAPPSWVRREYVDYAASKAAVDTMTKGLALEVAQRGVRVNAVRPGIIDTQIHASGGDPGRVSRLGPAQPMGRPGSAAEVAESVVWLLSPASSYVTGVVLDVSGGR